jgi:hypothetical protein
LHSKASQLKKKKKPETKSCKFEVPGVEIGGEVDEGGQVSGTDWFRQWQRRRLA